MQVYVWWVNLPKVQISLKQFERVRKISDAKSSKRGPSARSRSSAATLRLTRMTTMVTDAVRALRNNETKSTNEVKGPGGSVLMESKITYPSELVAAFRGLFGAGKEYDFQLHNVSTQTSTAGGGLLGSITVNPSVTSFAEWSALSSLFDEVVGISTRIEFLSLIGPAYTSSGATQADMVMAFDHTLLASSAPASVLAVYRLADSRTWVAQAAAGGSLKHSQRSRIIPRVYASIATPATVAPFSGIHGGWAFGNSGLFPVSLGVATLFLTVRARFRCRA